MNSDLPENFEVVSLSEAIEHPCFDARLREIVVTMAEQPGALSLDQIVAALGMDARAVAERFIAEAIGAEVLRCREVDAAKARGLN